MPSPPRAVKGGGATARQASDLSCVSGSSGGGASAPPSLSSSSPLRRRRRSRSSSLLPLVALVLLFFSSPPLPRVDAVTVIAASSLEACANDGKFDSSLNCTTKLVVSLAVESGAALETTSLDFDVSCVNTSPNGSSSVTCPCSCRHGADAGCDCADLETPLRVSVTKTPSYATYPLSYVQPFNYAPREAVIRTGSGFSSLTCDAGALSSSPTCGWATTGSGTLVTDRVPDSQGFCCDCSLDQLGSGTLGGGSTQATRGNLDCNLLSSLFIVPGSAHCLRHDSLWYEGYELGASLVDFEITVNATTTDSSTSSPPSTSSSSSRNLLLTPSSPSGALPSAGVAARLLGDLSSYASPPDFGGSMLLIPHPAGASLTTILTTNTSEWLIVDKTMVSLDGRQCDRVGTSYHAFRNAQATACSQPAGSCLNNQIRDLRSSDAQRVSRGEQPRYLIGRWNGGLPGARQAFRRGGTGPLWLGLPLPSTSASVVSLSVDAASVRVVTNVARGRVRSARVCAGSGPSPSVPPSSVVGASAATSACGGFQALTQKGVLTATVANEGSVSADFVVTATDCSSGSSSTPLPVLPPPAVYLSLRPDETAEASFDLHATSDFNSDSKNRNGVPDASCVVSVVDALGKTTDAFVVSFAVNATEFAPPPTDGGGDGDGGGGAGVPRETCRQRCPSWRSVWCRLRARCWREVLASAGVLAALAASAAVVACGFARGWWFRLCRCCRRRRRDEPSSWWSRSRRREQEYSLPPPSSPTSPTTPSVWPQGSGAGLLSSPSLA